MVLLAGLERERLDGEQLAQRRPRLALSEALKPRERSPLFQHRRNEGRRIGGILEPKKVAAMAEARSVKVAPHDGSAGYHGTAAAIEFAVLNLEVSHIVVCGHSHCGGIRALYEPPKAEAVNLAAWLELGREAALPVRVTDEALRRTEQRAVVLQLERLMGYPMVRERVEAGRLALHGWHYVLEEGEVHVFDVKSGAFVPAAQSQHSGTGPYITYDDAGP